MKKVFYIVCISLLFMACGGDDGGTPTPIPTENKAPSTPTQSAPANNLLCIDNAVTFEWTAATDPEGDAVSYELQIATNNSFTENLETRTSISISATVSLEKGVAYYWRIRAVDSKNAASEYSSSYNFYTEGEGESNHLPFLPQLVAPELSQVVQSTSVELKWGATDVDNDPLLFDVYFGLNNPPTAKIAENISDMSLTQSLDSSKDYYWKVVVKDDKGGETIGQIWTFKTD